MENSIHHMRRENSLSYIFALGIFCLPFTGVPGLPFLGELRGSLAVHVFLIFLAFSLFSWGRFSYVGSSFLYSYAFIFLFVLMGFLINFNEISVANLKGRSGVGKAFTSLLVLFFGIILSLQAPRFILNFSGLIRFFLRPLVCSIWVVAVFAIPEILSWFFGWGELIYKYSTALTQSSSWLGDFWRTPGRLASVAFEAPDLSYFSAFSIPWLLLYWRLCSLEKERGFLDFFPVILALILAALSGSRTGYLMILVFLFVEFSLWFSINKLRLKNSSVVYLLFVLLLFLLGAFYVFFDSDYIQNLFLPAFVDVLDESSSISNVSRGATLATQICLFQENPFFGVGFGQYAFRAFDCMPSWGLLSFEIDQWFFDPDYVMPPTFNFYGRVFSEFGGLGLLLVLIFAIAVLGGLVSRIIKAEGGTYFYLNALICSWVMVFVGALGTDILRRPETWILLGLLGSYSVFLINPLSVIHRKQP